MIEIRRTDGTAAGIMEAFRSLPGEVYRDDPVWAPEAESVVDDCLEDAADGAVTVEAMLAQVGGRPRARAMAIFAPGAGGAAEGWVGLFECCAGAPEAGVEVLRAADAWLRERGVSRVVAPRTDPLRSGLLVGGFDLPHVIFTSHNPAYYLDILSAAGFAVCTRMASYAYRRESAPVLPDLCPEGLRVRHPDPSRIGEELSRLEAFQAAVFGGSAGYVSRDRRGAGRLLRRLLPVMDLELVVVAEDQEGRVAGFLLCLPDAWQRRRPVDRARWVSVAVAPEWRRRGVGIAMGVVLLERLLAKGYQTLEASWVLDGNERAHLLSGLLGGRPGRSFALLAKEQ